MLRRGDLQHRLLSAAWQAAAAAQQREAHRAAGKCGGGAGGPRAAPASGGRHSSSSQASAAGDHHEAAKRERRRQRRTRNRELRERLCLNSAGFDFAASWQGQHQSGRSDRRNASAAWTHVQQESSSSESESEWEDWEVLEAVLGRPRTASERRKFGRVWREWQRASAGAQGGAANGAGGGSSSSSSSSSGSGSSGGRSSSWAGLWSDDEESSGGATYSAGNSAGPRWGKASWTWEDMQSEYGSRNGSASADYETWYRPPPGSGGSRRAAAGGSRSTGDAWGWHTSWQWSAGGAWHTGGWQSGGWQHDSWQHDSWHRSSRGSAGSGSIGSAVGGSTAAHLRLLGLESSWLSTRCGKALRCAFLAKAKAEHPDMHAAAGSGAAEAAKERFQRVTQAYEALLAMVRP